MRVHVVDPSAYTPPYDHALARALAARGADVELYTSSFAHGAAPLPEGYARRELFYRRASHVSAAGPRRVLKIAEHVPDMLRYRSVAARAEVVHFQWLAVQHLDGALLPRGLRGGGSAALVLTAHDILPREPRAGQRRAQERLYRRFDAVVVHSEHGRRRLTGELALPADLVHVIPHGALTYLSELPPEPAPLASELPVVLCPGLMRPYKGIDVLLEAWSGVEGAELWVAGMPRMDVSRLIAGAPAGVRFLTRYLSDGELVALLRRADLVVLPYREIDQSGMLFAALALGAPLLLSDAGGFPEVAATGAAETVPAGDPAALRQRLRELLGTPSRLAEIRAAGARAVAGPYSWPVIAAQTLALYGTLLERAGRPGEGPAQSVQKSSSSSPSPAWRGPKTSS